MGPLELTRCLIKADEPCDLTDKCNIMSPVNYLNKRLREFYLSFSLLEIIEGRPIQNEKKTMMTV